MKNISTEAGQNGQVEERPIETSERAMRPILLERFLPNTDIVNSRHMVVNATPEVTWAALKSVNFAKVDSLVMRGLLKLRILAVQSARRRLGMRPLSMPVKLTLDNVEEYGQVKLAERPGAEIVVGAIARPLELESLFERRTPAEFMVFDCPGYVKMGASFLVVPYGEKRTLLSYEARACATDTKTRRQFILWAMLTAPLMKLATRRMINFVKSTAEERYAPSRRAAQRAM